MYTLRYPDGPVILRRTLTHLENLQVSSDLDTNAVFELSWTDNTGEWMLKVSRKKTPFSKAVHFEFKKLDGPGQSNSSSFDSLIAMSPEVMKMAIDTISASAEVKHWLLTLVQDLLK